MRVAFLPLYDQYRPSSRYRVFQFIDPLKAAGIECSILPAPQQKLWPRLTYLPKLLSAAASHDVLFIQKRMLPTWVLKALQQRNPRLIFDLDDAVYIRPNLTKKINTMLRESNHILAGNNVLAEYAQQFNNQITVLPTVVDTNLYRPAIKSKVAHNQKIILGWIGSDPNRGDFAGMKPVLDHLHKHAGDKIMLRIIAARSLEIDTPLEIDFVPWTLAGSLQALQSIDIGIMPLENKPYNWGKCGFKLIQYMAVGAATVASPVGVNQTIVQHGHTGYLAQHLAEWQSYILELIENQPLRESMGVAAEHHVETHYSVNAALPKLIKTLYTVRKQV